KGNVFACATNIPHGEEHFSHRLKGYIVFEIPENAMGVGHFFLCQAAIPHLFSFFVFHVPVFNAEEIVLSWLSLDVSDFSFSMRFNRVWIVEGCQWQSPP